MGSKNSEIGMPWPKICREAGFLRFVFSAVFWDLRYALKFTQYLLLSPLPATVANEGL